VPAAASDPVADVRAGKLAAVYLVTGADALYAEELLAALRDAVVPGVARDLSYDLMRGDEVAGDAVVAAARTHPMLGARRLVVVRGHEMLEKKGAAALIAYFQSPCPTTVLCIATGKVDGRQKLWAAAQKSKQVRLVSAEPLRPWEAADWARGRARAAGLSLARDAAELLVEIVGPERAALTDALERLRLTLAPRTDPGAHEVAETLAATRLHTVFELCDAAGARNLPRALALCAAMRAAREPPIKVVAMLARQVRTLARARALGSQASAQTLGVPPGAVRKLVEQSRPYDEARTFRALSALAEADLALKSSRLGEEIILERLMLELCR
jgi:DNA polymerase-3 subunit delta